MFSGLYSTVDTRICIYKLKYTDAYDKSLYTTPLVPPNQRKGEEGGKREEKEMEEEKQEGEEADGEEDDSNTEGERERSRWSPNR